MREKINEKVSVVSYYSHKKGKFMPFRIYWQNKEYDIGELGLVHPYKDGDVWFHVFEVVTKDQTLSMRLNFNSKELAWTLEVVADGLPA